MPSIQDIMAKKKAFEAELSEFGKTALSEEFKKVFVAHPDLKAIQWRQYTPYFNDGDPCTFRVTGFEMSLTSIPEDDSKSDYGIDGFEPTWTTKGGRTPAGEAVSELARIDDEVYLAVFGDHCRVTATRTGFEVEEYDHD